MVVVHRCVYIRTSYRSVFQLVVGGGRWWWFTVEAVAGRKELVGVSFLLGACEAGVNFYFEAYVTGQGSHCNQMTEGHLRSTSTPALACPVLPQPNTHIPLPCFTVDFPPPNRFPNFTPLPSNPPDPLLVPFFPSHQRGDSLGVPGRAPAVGNRRFYVFWSSYSETGIKETNTFQGQGWDAILGMHVHHASSSYMNTTLSQ